MSHPTVHPETPRVAVAAGCTLGEGVIWDHRNGHLLWVDIKGQAVWRWNPASDKADRVDVTEPVGFVALTPDPDIVIAGFKSGLARLHLWGGQTQPLVSPEPGRPGNRINDGHVGPDGTLYFGTLNDGGDEPTGSFWRYDGEELNAFHGNIVTTNGPAVSANGRDALHRRFPWLHALLLVLELAVRLLPLALLGSHEGRRLPAPPAAEGGSEPIFGGAGDVRRRVRRRR